VGIAGQRGLPAHAILAGVWNGLVLFFELFPAFITIVAAQIPSGSSNSAIQIVLM
jgi:hypothetical protein